MSMTSDLSFILKFTHTYDQFHHENGILPNRLLSPIAENSAELYSLSIPTCSETPKLVLHNDNNQTNIDELYQKLEQYILNFQKIENYLNKLNEHFQTLTVIIQYLRNDRNLLDTIELFETRLLLMRTKSKQLNELLNHSSIKSILQQISSKILPDYHQFLTSIQLNLNQKSILIDHVNNEYRYRKYQLNDYISKLKPRQDLLMKLNEQIEQYRTQHDKLIQQDNHISIFNEHNRQCIELISLSNEYEQLRNENHRLTSEAKDNLRRYSSHFLQSNHLSFD